MVFTNSILNSTKPLLFAGIVIAGEKASGFVKVLSSNIAIVAPPVALKIVTSALVFAATSKNRYFDPTE